MKLKIFFVGLRLFPECIIPKCIIPKCIIPKCTIPDHVDIPNVSIPIHPPKAQATPEGCIPDLPRSRGSGTSFSVRISEFGKSMFRENVARV